MNAVVLSIACGAAYWCLIGFFALPRGVGGAVFWCILLYALVRDIRARSISPRPIEWIWLLAAGYLALSVSWTTNQLTLLGTTVILTSFTAWLYVRRFAQFSILDEPEGLLRTVQSIALSVVRNVPATVKSIRTPRAVNRQISLGLLLSLPIVLVLHLLFASVNHSYGFFVTSIARNIFTLDSLRLCLGTLFHGFLILTLATAVTPEPAEPSPGERPKSQSWTTVLGSVTAISYLFLCFQVASVAIMSRPLPFEILSRYVQKGFWQLLAASIIGYSVLLLGRMYGASIGSSLSPFNLSRAMLTALIVLVGVTLHKLVLLQSTFGFKDQRIAADIVLLLLGTGAIVELLKFKWNVSRIPIIATVAVLAGVLLSVVNVDLLSGRINPVRYAVGERSYRDVSYLLTNSYDNYPMWGELIEQIEHTELEPQGYYWGRFYSLCTKQYSNGQNTFYVRQRHQYLLDKYTAKLVSIRQIGRINFREYFAYRWLVDNEERVSEMYRQLETKCHGGSK